MTAEQCGSTSAWRAHRVTVTLSGAETTAGSTAGPVVTSPRTGSCASASAARCSNPSWRMTVLLRPTRTSGRPGEPAYGPPEAPLASSSSWGPRSEEYTSELQSHVNLVCRLLLEKKKKSQCGRSQGKRKKEKSSRHYT